MRSPARESKVPAGASSTPPPSRRRLRRVRSFERWVRISIIVLVVIAGGVLLVLLSSGSGGDRAEQGVPTSAATAPTSTSVPTDAIPGTGGARPFGDRAVWNQALPPDVPLSRRSDELVRSFNTQWKSFYGTVGINTNDYSVSVYTVPAGQPTVAVSIAKGCHEDPGLVDQLAAVPIPPDAQPPSGSDHTMVIWQPATNTAWELWIAQPAFDGSWSACWGGRIDHVSDSSGVFPAPYGVAASGLSYLGGAIKVSELQDGFIDHALAVNLVHTTAGTEVPPATRNDGNSTAPDAIPEGTRFRLDPKVDVTSLGLSPAGVTIARALQKYGMYVTDTSGAVVLMAENGQTYVAAGQPDPYAAIFGHLFSYQVLSHLPWNRLQVVASSGSS